MALHASDERRQSRSIEGGTRRVAEEIVGAVYLQLEAGTGINRIPDGRRPMNQRSAIRIGVIADTHVLEGEVLISIAENFSSQ